MARVETRFDGAVGFITLSHPPVNVIDFDMIAEINAFLAQLRAENRLCAVVFQAEGRLFSAGVDIGSHLSLTVERMIREFHSIFEALDDLAAPTVGVVRGACLGGACELIGYLDVVLATPEATFGVPEITLGVYPPVAAAFFPRRLGYQPAMHLLLTGEQIDAADAESIGLVGDVVPADQAEFALESVLSRLRDKSAPALRAVKRAALVSRGRFRDLVAPSERVYLDELMRHPDAEEGLKAFLDKRPPIWTYE